MADLPRVVIPNPVRDDVSHEKEVLDGTARLDVVRAADEDELVQRAAGAAGILLWHNTRMTGRSLSRLPGCRIIVRMGVGFDNVDLDAAAEHGIAVANVPDYGTEDVADSAVGMAVSLLRGIHLQSSRMRGGEAWSLRLGAPLGRVRGRVFGIVGIGRIGTASARRAAAFGMDVVFHDPYVPAGTDKALGVRRVETLDELLAAADVLSLHCPATDETRGLIGAAALAKMRPGRFLVNTARGEIVDPDAVAAALERGHLAGAGLDVLPVEPPGEAERLLRAWRDPSHPAHHRLILTPHTAFYTEEGLVELRRKGADACRRALRGLPVPSQVNSPRRG